MTPKALQLTLNLSGGTSTIHVYSLSTNVLQHFEVECMGSQLGAPPENETRSLIAKSAEKEEMNAACAGTSVADVIAPDPTAIGHV